MENRKIKAAIFDLDGTLAFTAADLLKAINYMLKERFDFLPHTMEEMMTAVNFCERDYVEAMVKLGFAKAGKTDFVPDAELIDRCVGVYTEYYGEHYCDETCVYPGLTEAVDQMKRSGLRLAVDTNKKAEHAEEIVRRLLPGRFEIVVGDGAVASKPNPEGALKIAERFGLAPSEILFIGDSDVDIRTAKNAGMTAVGVSWGYRDEETLRRTGADVVVRTPDELPALCGIA